MAEKTFHSLTLPGQDTARVPLTAAEFSTSVAYNVKDYCTYQGKLYRCITAHAAGAWNAAHFIETNVDAEFDRKLDIPVSQASAPANPRVGDLWIDNDENSPIYNVDASPTLNSTNAVQSGGTKVALNSLDSRKMEHGVITGDFSASVDYRVGDLVFYATTANGITTRTLYRCTTNHDAAAWNAAHFTATTLEVELQSIRDNEADTDMIGDLFGTKTTYAVGDYCIYNDNLYRCIQAVDNTGVATPAFDPDDWTQVALANDVSDLNSAIDTNQELIDADIKAAGYVTGLNFVPPLWEAGGINSTGMLNTNGVRSKIFIPVVAGQNIVCINDHSINGVYVAIYDASYAFIERPFVRRSKAYILPANAAYVKLHTPLLTYDTTIKIGLAYASTAQEYQEYILSSPTITGLNNANPSLQEETFDFSELINNGQYILASTGDINTNSNFFYTNSILLHKGEGFRITAKGSGTAPAWISKWTANGTFIKTIAASSTTLQTVTYLATDEIEYIRFSNNNVASTTPFNVIKLTLTVPSIFPIIVREQITNLVPKKHIITVGTGKNYTSLVDAINSITDSSEENLYIIYLYPGEYETVVESEITTNYKGLIIPDYVSIIGIGNRDSIVIKGNLPSASYAEYANTISTLNLTMNGTVENVTIKAKNLRYCNHDDGTNETIPGSMTNVKHTFRRVKWVSELTDTGITTTAYCTGIGAQANKEVVFEDCVFINENANKVAVMMHDNAANSQVNGGRLYVKNCIFTLASGCDDVRLANSGGSMETYAYLIGNAFSLGVVFTSTSTSITTNVWKLFATGNKNYSLTKKIGMIDVDLSADITEFNNIATT